MERADKMKTLYLCQDTTTLAPNLSYRVLSCRDDLFDGCHVVEVDEIEAGECGLAPISDDHLKTLGGSEAVESSVAEWLTVPKPKNLEGFESEIAMVCDKYGVAKETVLATAMDAKQVTLDAQALIAPVKRIG